MKFVSLEVWCPDLTSEEGVARWRYKLSRDWPWVLDDPGIVVEAWGLRRRGGPGAGPRFAARGPVMPMVLPAPLAVALAWFIHFVLTVRTRGRTFIVAPTPYTGLGAACARALRPRVPLVVRVMGNIASKQRLVHGRPGAARVVEGLEAFVLRRADLVVPMGAFTRSMAGRAQVHSDRIVELPFPTAWRDGAVPNAPKGSNLVACAARLVPEKGVDVLIGAFATVVQQFPRARLEVAGDGPERPRLEGLARRLGIQDHVMFHGWLQPVEMSRFWARAAIAVLPSRVEEGLGMVLVEAALAGCALVGSDLGGIRDIVRPERNGFLVPPEDSEALGAVLSRLLRDPDSVRALGAAARQDALAYLSARERGLEDVRRRVLALTGGTRSGRRG